MSLLTINNLVRNYAEFSLGPIDLQINAGETVGLIGANGAGKSTLFRALMGLVRKQQGEVEICGNRVNDNCGLWRQQTGYIGDAIPLFDSWNGQRNLEVLSRFYPRWDQDLARDLARRLQLDLSLKVSRYSTGQRAKLAIVLALAHRPAILLLDEPANGLDPVARETFTDLLIEAVADGERAVLYATHHVAEIEQFVDRLVFLKQGQIVADAIKEDLTENWRKLTFRSEGNLNGIPRSIVQRSEHPWREVISSQASTTTAWLEAQGVDDVQSSRLSLEKISVQILKQNTLEQGASSHASAGEDYV